MDIVIHYIVPFLLLKLFDVKHRFLPFLALIALLPDLDKLIGVGRMTFHNVFFVLIIIFLVYVFFRKNKEGIKVTALTTFFLFSHLLLDLGGPIAMFFPLSPDYYLIEFAVKFFNFIPFLYLNFSVVTLGPEMPHYIISTASMGIILLLLILFLVKKRFKK
ncbi:MAG: metal-dependent hydrolase [archaeon]|nr:hypothetical protein [Candidatus Micrarchaeota archaeon]